MKSSMQTRLIMISSGMLVLAIACICFANIFWLPYYYQSEKVSNMKNAYNNVVKQVSGVEWGSISEDERDKLEKGSSAVTGRCVPAKKRDGTKLGTAGSDTVSFRPPGNQNDCAAAG